MKKRVLILCTGNSCRSQMAERIWEDVSREIANVEWVACSAGSNPSGYVHPLALAAIKELDLSTDGLESKHVDRFEHEPMDLVITVCDNAKEACPVFSSAVERLHWPFADPADATGSDAEKMVVFRRVRDEIRNSIAEYLTTARG